MPRWTFQDTQGQEALLPTEFNHYEGALAHTLGLPTLVLVQKNVRRRVVFDMSFGGYVGEFDANASLEWLHTQEFRVPFHYWTDLLEERRDVFLGYSSSSEATAASIKRFLLSMGAKVLDWQTDFIPGRTILDQIEQAAAPSIGGIFLFTKDDDLVDRGQPDKAVPRDNVIFEAGYFIGLKGKRNVLVIREAGSKMPADLGGDIYASLLDKTNITPIERSLLLSSGNLTLRTAPLVNPQLGNPGGKFGCKYLASYTIKRPQSHRVRPRMKSIVLEDLRTERPSIEY